MRLSRSTRIAFNVCSVLILGLSVLGCGGGPDDRPELGEVEGTVTMDDQPLVGAEVQFQPEKGRPSKGITDEAGHYVLNYKDDVPGAAVGKHKVTIRTYRPDNPDAEDPALQKGQKETVPVNYNDKTELVGIEVKAGQNEPIDFKLKSGGKVVQPNNSGE